ncbi:uncharacterized protein LOC112565071 [Pomacea canaliculata]|uniref:uncharacterized protein LOC112565071 n=1 Tax=Pomacea canaliculata TaxID=400727 RepID=UPI000D73F41E|nr:uncharacterized protein LOC112565071 [Pomacea canaliculata]
MARPVVVVLLLLLAACISLTTARRRAFHRALGKTHKKSIERQFVTSPAPDGDKDDDLGFVRLSFRKKPKGSPQITIRLSNGTDVFPPGTGQLSSKEGLTIDLQNLET